MIDEQHMGWVFNGQWGRGEMGNACDNEVRWYVDVDVCISVYVYVNVDVWMCRCVGV